MKQLPRILIDTREQKPLRFDGFPIKVKKLEYGDYSLHGLEKVVAVERKALADLWGTLSQPASWSRFERELGRAMCDGCRLHVVVESSIEQALRPSRWCAMDPRRVLDRLWESCHRMGASAVFAGSRAMAPAATLAILRGAWRAHEG